MRLYENIIICFAERISKRILNKTVRNLQAIKETLDSDDGILENTWEEICAQVQEEEWLLYWDVQMEVVDVILNSYLEEIPHHEQLTIWLQSEAGWDWAYDHNDENVSIKDVPMSFEDMVTYLRSQLIDRAEGYTNERIRSFFWRRGI